VITLRPYQQDQNDRVRASFGRVRSVVSQMPTGAGKTATAADAIRRSVALGNRALFLAHLDTLIGDTFDRLRSYDVPAGYVQAGRPSDPTAPVQVASLQTLHARGERPPADLVILDECHRALGPTVRAILSSYPRAYLLGLTATPVRSDDQPLGDVYEELVTGPSVRQLTHDGHLVPCDVVGPTVPVEALLTEPVEAYERWGNGTRALVFASSVEHARWVTASFNARGIAAESVTGETSREDRERLRAAIRSGTTRVLVSVRVFVEGWDEPSIETIILARDYGHVGSFLQSIGRGLRPCAETGKRRCTVIDLRGSANVLGLPDEDRVWSLTGRPRRTEKLSALRRCLECAAIFRPATCCPRCGARVSGSVETKIPRVLTREEKAERLSDLPQHIRDERYFFSLVRVASTRMRKSPAAARMWAMGAFRKRFGRNPEVSRAT
jgi:DNA repair protein RadD